MVNVVIYMLIAVLGYASDGPIRQLHFQISTLAHFQINTLPSLPVRLALFYKGFHTFFLVFAGKQGVEVLAFKS